MLKTIEMLEKYKGNRSYSVIAAELGCVKATIAMAKKAGRLSPELAAKIAEFLGENPIFWMAVAAAEQQQEPIKTALLEVIERDSAWRARRDSNPRPLPSEGGIIRRTAEFCARFVSPKMQFCQASAA